MGICVFDVWYNSGLIYPDPRHLHPTRYLKKNWFGFGSISFGSGIVRVHNSTTCNIHVILYQMRPTRFGYLGPKETQSTRKLKSRTTKKCPKIKQLPENIQISKRPKILPEEPKTSKVLSKYPKYIF